MSDYTQVNDYSVKDGLTQGDPNKLIKGADVDADLAAISVAIATKYDSADIASLAEAQAETLNSVLITPLRLANWADANGGVVGDLQAYADPNADRLFGWDETSNAAIGFTLGPGLAFNGTTVEATLLGIEDLTAPAGDRILFYDQGGAAAGWLTVSTGLTLSGTTLTVNDSAINHDSLTGFVADEHVAHSGVTLTAGVGLSGGGTIAASRQFDLDITEIAAGGATDAVDLDADTILGYDSDGAAQERFYAAALVTPEVGTTVSGTADTLAETDFGKVIRYSSTSTVTVTLPNGLKTGFWAVLMKTGATGNVNLSATTTLQVADGLNTLATQYASCTVFHLGSNVWTAWGNLE